VENKKVGGRASETEVRSSGARLRREKNERGKGKKNVGKAYLRKKKKKWRLQKKKKPGQGGWFQW